eukprot:SAG31_NODE_4240_length_3427_cov_2.557392_2_plen_116_part_00
MKNIVRKDAFSTPPRAFAESRRRFFFTPIVEEEEEEEEEEEQGNVSSDSLSGSETSDSPSSNIVVGLPKREKVNEEDAFTRSWNNQTHTLERLIEESGVQNITTLAEVDSWVPWF